MRDTDTTNSCYEQPLNDFSYPTQENSSCHGIKNVNIMVNKKRWKKRKKHRVLEHGPQPTIIAVRLSRFSTTKKKGSITRNSSLPELKKSARRVSTHPPQNKNGREKYTKQNKYKRSLFQSHLITNVVAEHRFDSCFSNPFNNPCQTKWKIYRCQLGTTSAQDVCCCSCNSDAMFEVMKGLYDCYKAKNCDNCWCVLCRHKTEEERRIDELRKSMTSVAREKILDGKTPEQKETVLNAMAKQKIPLPAGKTASEKALIDKVRKDLGLPPSPKTAAEKTKMRKAEAAGLVVPLEGKSPAEKEQILKNLYEMGIPLPEGRTDSEKALIAKVQAVPRVPSLKPAGYMTPLAGKTAAEKEKILRTIAMAGLPLPEPQTPSEKKLLDKVRTDLGLPKEPTTPSIKEKMEQAAKVGLLQPLEGKTPSEKEKILQGLQDRGIPLPEGRTPSEKAIIAKVKAKEFAGDLAPSERMRRAKAAGLLTPLKGKKPEEKEKILKGLAMAGLPLPEGQTASEKKLIVKVRADLGLPKEPLTETDRAKLEQAAKAGLLQPLEGKTPAEKEKILKNLHELGIPLPEGRTPSEKALIANIAALPRPPSIKTAGMMTPLKGKSPIQKEKILRKLAEKGVPLPEAQTPSEKKIIDRVRADMGLPKEPATKSIREKHEKAAKAGLLKPLEGKTPKEKERILRGLHDMGIPLPEGRTPSEKALIAKLEALSRGMLTPLTGKTPAQKEKILRKLAEKGMPLPEAQTPSEKIIIDKVRADMGLPKEPATKSIRDKHEKAAKAGLLQPLEGKTPDEKKRILKRLHDMGIPLPEGRTPSEKALIANVEALSRAPSVKTAGMLTPLTGKTPAQKEKILRKLAEKGIPLPEGQTPSEKKIIDDVRADMGLPKEPATKSIREKHEKAAKAGLLQPLEGKTPKEKERILRRLHDMGIPLPEGRTPSEKALIANVEALSRAPSVKTAGMLTPLTGKSPAQKEKILRKLAEKGIPLPEAKTPSEKKIIDRVRADMGLPEEPATKSLRDKYEIAAKAGLLQPLEGKTPAEKEKILKDLHEMGIPLPEGRTPSEKALIANIAALPRPPSIKTAGMMTPLTGKSPIQKEKILRKLAEKGIPLPEGKTPSEKKIIDRVRADMGLPKEPATKSIREKHEKAAKAGLLQPLEGKTPDEKKRILKRLHDMGIPLPEGRTPSEKALIANVEALSRAPSVKTAGMLTPLTGKTPAQKEKILRKLAEKGIPLPEGQTPSEKKLIDEVRADMGLPKEPATKSIREKHEKAAKAGLLQPLEGKTPKEKERILRRLHDMGIPLPEGRTPSEKALIANVETLSRAPSVKTAGMLTPLTGKTPAQKEKILRKLAEKGIPLPEAKTPSEKKIIDRVRADMGLPEEPATKSIRDKHEIAAKAGLLQPLEGKTPAEKEKILKDLHEMGIPLPEGRTPSEKALIANIAALPRPPSIKTAGMMTPLTGKSPIQKEKILRKLAEKGIPLPEGKTPSEKKIIDRVRADMGLPKEPATKSIREKHEKAAKAGLLQPLEGKTPDEKKRILKRLHDMGIPLPEGRTPSEKALIANIEALPRAPSVKTAGMLTPLTGKTPAQKEKILRKLAEKGIPLPEGQTPSEKKLIDEVRADMGLPKEPATKSIRDKHERAAKAGLLQPLEGKTPAEKEKILKDLHEMGIPLPDGRTPSEKALIANIAALPRPPSIKTAGMLTPLTGKSPIQKEKILRKLAEKGVPLPEGQTPSEKKMIDRVRADMGLPKEPATKSIREKHEKAAKAGLLQPLEGKTPDEKKRILKRLHDMGIPLPEGRTPSEKALIANVEALPRAPSVKTAGMLTPLTGKTPAQKEKILRKLAEKGIPLPEGQTPSEKKLIDEVRADMGLPKEPATKSIRDKHERAAKAGLLQPLEGKTPAEKQKILKDLHELGIPLPEGRTPSEKALIANIAALPRPPSIKTVGMMTPLTGKSPIQKEKILRKLAEKGVPLPEGKTPSEKKIIDRVRADMGLPKEPATKSIRDKHEKAAKAGLLQPLEGKTPEEKERILKRLHDMGIPLPEGRTPSEKALIANVEALSRAPSVKTAGMLTPLTGKSPIQKEKILRKLAEKGIPLPEGQTPSEKKLIDEVRADMGLPKEPATKSIRDKHERAAKAGLLQPLEGKTPAEKEKILKDLHELGIPLPEGRTPSEKALIANIAALPRPPSIKTVGMMTPLTGKSPIQKEKILRKLAEKGIPLPEGKTPSEKKIIDRVRADMGLPKEPATKSIRDKHEKAAKAGLLQPLEGKTPEEKERILRRLHDMGIPLPEGRTPSEKALIANVEALSRAPSVKTAGMLTPLTGKSPIQKEKILRKLAEKGIPLPEGQTPSEKKLIDEVRADMGLPKEPATKSIRDKHERAAKAGLLQPLEGKTPAEKEKILKDLHEMGIPLPEGRTPSEKALIANIAALPRPPSIKTAGMMTPLTGKSPIQKEKILRKLAEKGVPLPEGQTPSEKKIIDRVRADMGLPKEPATKSIRDKHEKAAKAGLLQPLEGKTPEEKEKILKRLHDMGIPLPEGRTPSEKALIANVEALPRVPSVQTAGMLTPLTGKTPAQKEKILRKLAEKGIPLPKGQTPSEKKLINKVRAELGLPKEPATKSMRDKHEKAAKAGLLQPLEGKTPAEKEKILKGLHDMGISLPEGRTPSEKALIDKVKAAPRGIMTPLAGKTPEEKEKSLRTRAMKGLPLPEAQTPSEKKLIEKVRTDLGLPKEPTTKSLREKHEKAAKAGLLQPLEGMTPAEKEKTLKGLHDLGIPLPEGRTPSEKVLIAKVAASSRHPSRVSLKTMAPSEKMRIAKTEGLLTPLAGKTPDQKEKILKGLANKGLPLPEGQTPSERKLIDKVRAELGLPKEPATKSMRNKHELAAKAGLLKPLEGKTPAEKEKILKGLHDMGISLPEGRTPSEKALIDKVKAVPRGIMTPLAGKTPEEKEKSLRTRAMKGLPLPEAQTPSEKKLIEKVRTDLGLPKEPTTKSLREKHEKAAKAGLLQPLEGMTPAEKEKTLKGLHDLGVPLPEGRTPSEKALIAKVAASSRHPSRVSLKTMAPSEKMRIAKTEGLLTPLAGKTPDQKEKILKGLANKGLPLPEGQTPSEKKLIDKVRAELGLPKEPATKSMRDKHELAAKAGLLKPLEGKTPAEKEKILKGLHDMGISLPEGRTPSEKALIDKVKAAPRGIMTPLAGKTPEEKEKSLRTRAMKGLPLPEAQTPSEKKLIEKVRTDLGLPKEPTTKSLREKHEKAAKAGLLQPLEGMTPAEKEKTLKGLHDLGVPLPEGRTPSEKALIAKVAASSRHPSRVSLKTMAPSEKMRIAKTEGLLTPLAGKTPDQKEKILKGLANKGLPLPEGQTPSEKKLIDKVRAELGLPKEPATKSMRNKHELAAKAGLLKPLEGKTPAEKEKILKGLHDMGISLPEGRTPSEKALIDKVKAAPRGIMTPLAGKTPEEKEKSLRTRAMKGLPLPEAQTPSEKKLIEKVRTDLGLPKEPTTKSLREKHEEAAKAGLLQPLEGMTPAEKEKTLKGLHDLGVPLPEGRTPSEKALIAKVAASSRHPSRVSLKTMAPSEKMRIAKTEGLLTPLAGKTPDQKEKILKGLANKGLPLPEGQTPSEKKLIDKVRAELGLPKEPATKSMRDKHELAAKAGILKPLEGKTPAEKEKILKGLHDLGIPLPEGRTPSEKALVNKVMGKVSLPTITSDKIRKAKAAGLFTPLTGKTPEQKEKILRGLATTGLPLPEGKTLSEKALIAKVKKDFDIIDKTPSEKLRKAKITGLLTPLEGKSPDEKEKILRGRAAAGLPLPMGKSPSERALVQKIKNETGYVTPSPSERIRKAKAAGLITPLKGKTPSMKEKILQGMQAAGVPIPEGETPSEKKLISKFIMTPSEKLKAGLLTPLEGKTPAQKQKILEGLARAGLPLPEGKTKSEKSMISKIKARTPPPAITPSEKSVVRKAKAAGLFTPLTGKAPAEKERILKGLAEAGLPLPEGKTPSEKELVKKIRAETGLPPEPTPSEKKGAIRKKTKKVGISASKKAAGIEAEELEEVIKTTVCDRACGCDKKKIKFKHSYVKIRVTSPDISSFCDCPGECIPGVKSGAFIDNEGIKVTVGSAVGTPTYSIELIDQQVADEMISNTDLCKIQTNDRNNLDDTNNSNCTVTSLEFGFNNNSSSGMSYSTISSSSPYSRTEESLRSRQSSDIRIKSGNSFETILVINSEMSLSTSTSNSMDSISSTSLTESSSTSSSAYYSGFQSTNDLPSINSLDVPTSDDFIDYPSIVLERNIFRTVRAPDPQQYTIMRVAQQENNFGNNNMEKIYEKSDTKDVLPSKIDVSKIMNRLMSKKRFADASVIFIVTCDDEEDRGSSNVESSISMQSSECRVLMKSSRHVDSDSALKPSFTKRNELVCGKGKKFYLEEILSTATIQNKSLEVLRRIERSKEIFRTLKKPNEPAQMLVKFVQGVGSDTRIPTVRPCCISKDHHAANVVAGHITPLYCKGVGCFSLPGTGMAVASSSIPVCVTPWSADPCASRETCHHLGYRGRNHQKQSPTSPPPGVCPPDNLKVPRNQSVKVQKPSIGLICHEGESAVIEAGLEFNILPVFDPSSSPMPQVVCHYGPSQQNPTSAWPPSDEMKVIRNRSAKVQIPSIESICHEGGNAPEKLANMGWLRKSPEKDPNEPKHLESSNSSKLKQTKICFFKQKNLEQNTVEPELKSQPMPRFQQENITPSPQPERANPNRFGTLRWPFFRLTDPYQQPGKLSDKSSPVPQNLASSKTAKQKEEEMVGMCKSDTSINAKEPEKLTEEVTLVPEKLTTTKTAKQKEEEKSMSPNEPEKLAEEVRLVLQNLASTKTTKQLESPKGLKSQKSSNKASILLTKIKKSLSKRNEYIKNKIGQLAPGKVKDKDLKSQKSSNKASILLTKIKKSLSKRNESIKNKIGQLAPGKVKDKYLQSPKVTETSSSTMPRKKRCPPQLPPVLLGLQPVPTPEGGNLYEVIGPSCKWIETGDIKNLRSKLTQLTSGFKASKRKKIEKSHSEESIELDFGNAIRYFASMNPERFQQLMQEELQYQPGAVQEYEGKESKKLKKIAVKEKRKIEKAEKKGKKRKISKTTTTVSTETFESRDESESSYPQGFKFSIAVKGCPAARARLNCTKVTEKQFFKS